MTTTPVTATTTAPPAATSASSNGTDPSGALNFTQNFDTFLRLLTTQLKNQNPLSPMDTRVPSTRIDAGASGTSSKSLPFRETSCSSHELS